MSKDIRFLLGEDERTLRDVSPTLTVLEYLRRHARRTGTKEGCAEGDCGACTVVLAEPDGTGDLRYRAVNACIQFVPALHGRQLLTVEDVKRADGTLHPVQQALVDRHGSQCGFCTPGFVMQLYAGWLEGTLKDRQSVKDWVAGNLCRCTGYGPIIDAGLDVAAAPRPAAAAQAATAGRLAALDDGHVLHVAHGGQQWFAPRSIDELADLYSKHPDAVLIAGATDVGLWVTKQQRHLATLIDVTRVAGLNEIKETVDGLAIGAAVSHRDATAALARLHPDLGELLRRFASIQIRNAGTVGGNIANGSPIGDLPPALIALGARLRLHRGATRRELPLETFFLDAKLIAVEGYAKPIPIVTGPKSELDVILDEPVEMDERHATELVQIMVQHFPKPASWSQLKDKMRAQTGVSVPTFKRALRCAYHDKQWLVAHGKGRGRRYNLNPNGCWQAASGSASSHDVVVCLTWGIGRVS